MVDVYSTEPERQAAIAEVTRLRRQFDTTTAKGAKAFAADPEAQAAMARLDKAKSAAGMRTRAEDLAFINKVDSGKKTNKQVTQALNRPSRQYFNQVQEAYTNPEQIPTWTPPKQITPQDIANAKSNGVDLSKANYRWVWQKQSDEDPGAWAIGLVGSRLLPPKQEFRSGVDSAADYGFRSFASDTITAKEWSTFLEKNEPEAKQTNPLGLKVGIDEIAEELPDIRYTQLQEIIYRLTLERDMDITIDDILDKYDELFGEG